MQRIVGRKSERYLVVIYIRYYSIIDFLQWDVESTSKLDCKGDNTPMDASSLHSKLIYHDDMVYESWIDFQFTLVHNGILVIM